MFVKQHVGLLTHRDLKTEFPTYVLKCTARFIVHFSDFNDCIAMMQRLNIYSRAPRCGGFMLAAPLLSRYSTQVQLKM